MGYQWRPAEDVLQLHEQDDDGMQNGVQSLYNARLGLTTNLSFPMLPEITMPLDTLT